MCDGAENRMVEVNSVDGKHCEQSGEFDVEAPELHPRKDRKQPGVAQVAGDSEGHEVFTHSQKFAGFRGAQIQKSARRIDAGPHS
jgi:hypothetical protein